MEAKILKLIIKILLISVVAITPFFKIDSLYFPYISGRVYLFRALVMLVFFFWIWLMLKDPSTRLRASFKNILVIALVLFFSAQIFVSFFGVDPVFSFFSGISRADGVLEYGFWVLYLLLIISVFKEKRDWQIFFSVFIIVSFLLSVFAWLGYPPEQELYGNFFGNPAYFSGFLIFSIGFSLLAFERKYFYPNRFHYFLPILAVFFSITLIFTQIRGAFIGLAAGIFLFSFLSILFLRRENKKLAFVCGIVLLLCLVSVIFLFSARETNFVKNNYSLSRLTEIANFQKASSAKERLLVWQIALKAFQERPIFGFGPENFSAAVNKYYDHWLGERETWFDRAHNVPLEILATGGLVLFSFYLFWLTAAVYLIFKISRQRKILSFILAGVLTAYIWQGFFLFDVFAIYFGLFPFLGFLVFQYNSLYGVNTGKKEIERKNNYWPFILIAVALFVLSAIYASVFLPWRANNAVWQFYGFTEAGFYREAKPFLEKSFSVKSPYTYWQVRKEAGWQFLSILEDKVGETITLQDRQAIEALYDFIVSESERFIENNPYEPQMYYVLGKIYQAGFEKLGRNDLVKAETVLKKALDFSDLRKEYFDELGRVLLMQGKFEEAEQLLQDYLKRVDFHVYYPYLTLGHFYFEAEKYEQAFEQYEKAKQADYDFCRIPAEYSRYMFSAEKKGEYRKIVEMAKKYLDKQGPDAATFFNIAVGYFHLGDRQTAKEFFLKAVELDGGYKQYQSFFLD